MKRTIVLLCVAVACVSMLSPAWAHETKVVAGKFKVIFGFTREPIFTDERNGLDLIVLRADNDAPVENLERSVSAVLISPDGRTARGLKIRPQFGRPGRYTDDVILSTPGVYRVRIFGAIEDVTFDETFETHEVRRLTELRFP